MEQLEARARGKRGQPTNNDMSASSQNAVRKKWEDMSGAEKLWDLWTREKGILWYLNRSVRTHLNFFKSFFCQSCNMAVFAFGCRRATRWQLWWWGGSCSGSSGPA